MQETYFGYEDIGALILREGATLAGKVEPSAAFEAQFRPGIMTVPQLEASASCRNELVMRLAVAHEDPADEQLGWKLKASWTKGGPKGLFHWQIWRRGQQCPAVLPCSSGKKRG